MRGMWGMLAKFLRVDLERVIQCRCSYTGATFGQFGDIVINGEDGLEELLVIALADADPGQVFDVLILGPSEEVNKW